MPKLIKTQPETLLQIVKFAKKHSEIVPTDKQLGELLNIKKRTASKRRKSLIDGHCEVFIVESPRRIKINEAQLCIECKTACLLLKALELREISDDGAIPKNEIIKAMSFNGPKDTEAYLNGCITAGYLQIILADPGFLRTKSKLDDHLEYIKLLSKENKA